MPTLARPQLTIATAIVFYHRFYSRKSYDGYDRFRIATTCLFLAGKVEETPKKIKDVVIETYKAQHGAAGKASGPDPESKEFWSLKEEILVCERILLQTLDFDLTVEHAYRRAPLPRRPACRHPRTRPQLGPDSTDGPGPVAQAAARVREEHQGHARLGAGCLELYQRQPAHDHCSAGAPPPPASGLPPPASRLPPRAVSALCATPYRTAHTARVPFACAVPAAMCGGGGGPPVLSVPGQQDGAAHSSR